MNFSLLTLDLSITGEIVLPYFPMCVMPWQPNIFSDYTDYITLLNMPLDAISVLCFSFMLFSWVFFVVVMPDNSFQTYFDNTQMHNGNLLEDME